MKANSLTKPCMVCRKPVTRCMSHFRSENVFCSGKCSGLYMRKRVVRACKNCQKEFEVKTCLIKLGFGKYCCESCRRQFQKLNKIPRSEVLAKYNNKESTKLNKRLWHESKFFSNKQSIVDKCCIVCFATEDLVIHHVDGNNGRFGKPLNNAKENLVVVCRSCHPKYHNRWGLKEVVSSA